MVALPPVAYQWPMVPPKTKVQSKEQSVLPPMVSLLRLQVGLADCGGGSGKNGLGAILFDSKLKMVAKAKLGPLSRGSFYPA